MDLKIINRARTPKCEENMYFGLVYKVLKPFVIKNNRKRWQLIKVQGVILTLCVTIGLDIKLQDELFGDWFVLRGFVI